MADRAHTLNAQGQPIGLPLTSALPRPRPPHAVLTGQACRMVPLRADHAAGLFAAFGEDKAGLGWTYLPEDPWQTQRDADNWCTAKAQSTDPLFYVIEDLDGTALGHCSYLRIAPEVGSVEVGYIHFAPRLQQTRAATEAMFLMMQHVFDDLGYRRYEWKCDALNAPSRQAAQRLGFSFEGIFRQAAVYKGRNRDTAWFSILDEEWPALKARFRIWLVADNFREDGQQKRRLSEI